MIVNATNARTNLFKLMDAAIVGSEPVTITGKSGNVVMISESDYRSMMETMYLSSIPGMREQLIAGRDAPASECVVDDGNW